MPPVKEQARSKSTDKPRVTSGVGGRIRAARAKAGMTQQQVAGDRYTKAYISALENGLVRPSVAALEYLAGRLGTSASALMADAQPGWSRMDADLRLASGEWQSAADAYDSLLRSPLATENGARAEMLRGLAEAMVRLDRGAEAAAAASEAVEIFESLGRHEDGALASYWLSAGMYEQNNTSESNAILQAILAKVRTGLHVEPDFKVRLLIAISATQSRDGNHEAALSYLEEVRGLADELDDRRRAAFLHGLANSYCETGDYEAAIRTGYASLALFRAAETSFDMARLENELAIAHLNTGNLARADEMALDSAKRFADLGDDRQRAHVLDTQAQIALARGDATEAMTLASESLALAQESDNGLAVSDALLTIARAHAAGGSKDTKATRAAFERAAADARQSGRPQAVKRALTSYADWLAASGDHKQAFELSREALATSR